MRTIIKIFFLLLIACSVKAQAPPAPSGFPAPYSAAYYRIGWLQSDSGLILASRDTSVRSKFAGLMFLWQHAGLDSSQWFYNGSRYIKTFNSQDTLPGRFLVTNSALNNQGFLKNITGFVQQGTNVTITGSGTLLSPYVINSTASGGGDSAVNPGLFLGQSISGTTKTLYNDTSVTGFSGYYLRRKDSALYVTQTQLSTGLSSKQNSLTTGTTLQYFRGDLSLATFPTNLSAFTNGPGYITGNQSISFTASGDVSGTFTNPTTLTPTLTIGNNKVTYAKFQASSQQALLGATGAGNFQEITLGTGLSMSGNTLNATGGAGISVDTIYRTLGKDSIQFTIGGRYHSILDSAGGSGTSTLTNTHIFVGNASNVATDVALSGDATMANTGALTLNTVNSNVGSFGSASSVATFTANGKGLLTAAGSTSIQIAESQVTNLTTDLAGKQATGNYITALTGDVTASGPGSVAATIANNAITTVKINNNAVTYGKFQAASGASLLGATGAGNFGEITLGTGLSFAGSVLNAAAGGATNSNIGSGFRFAVPSTNNIKTIFCSGCTLDSTTNANALTLTVSGSGLSYPNTTDKYLNGYGNFVALNTDSITIPGTPNGAQLYSDTLTGLINHIKGSGIVFNQGDSLVFFGDSYGNAAGATTTSQGIAQLLAQRLGAFLNNQSASGSTIEKRTPLNPFTGVNFIDRLPNIPHASSHVKYIIIWGGLNDYGVNSANYNTTNLKTDLDSVINYLIGTKGFTPEQILICSAPWNGSIGQASYAVLSGNAAPTTARLLSFIAVAKTEAAFYGTGYFAPYWYQLHDTTPMSADGIHPNDAGYAYLAHYLNITNSQRYIFPTAFTQSATMIKANVQNLSLVLGDQTVGSMTSPPFIDQGKSFASAANAQANLKQFWYRDAITTNNCGIAIVPGTVEIHTFSAGAFDFMIGNVKQAEFIANRYRMFYNGTTASTPVAIPTSISSGGSYNTTEGSDSLKFFTFDPSTGSAFAGIGAAANSQYYNVYFGGHHAFFINHQKQLQLDLNQLTLDSNNTVALTIKTNATFSAINPAGGSLLINASAGAVSKAAMDIRSITGGLLIPRYTTSAIAALTGQADGFMYYDSVLHAPFYWNGTAVTPFGSGGTPGGSNTQVQFNNSGAFGGSANLTFNGTTLTANAMAISTYAAAGTNDSVVMWNPSTKLLEMRSGVFNLNVGNGLSPGSTTDSIIFGGTLTRNTTLGGGNFSLALGTSGSKLSALTIWSTAGLNLTGGQYNSVSGSEFLGTASTINNAITSASGNVNSFAAYAFMAPTITSTNTGVTYATPATVLIDGPPTMSTNSTATGAIYSLNVVSGGSHFGVGSSNQSIIANGGMAIDGGTYNSTIGLSLGASTTTHVSVNFLPGVDATGAVSTFSGNMWYNGTNLYLVDGSSTGVKRDILNGIHNYLHTIFTPTTGGTVALVANQYNIVNPAGALATLTVNFPSTPNNNDVVYIKYTQTVSAVTYGNGTAVSPITAPVAGGLVVWTYDVSTTSWY